MIAHKHLLKIKVVTFGKGAIRYSKAERIDFNVVESMLRDSGVYGNSVLAG
jgi:hypothetical protein